MTPIFLGLGSNIDPAINLPRGLAELEALLGPLEQSATYEGAAMGFDGDPFWNLVVAVATDLEVVALQAAIREIEYRHGRSLHATRNSPRALDIDILTFGDAVGEVDGVALPRGEILEHAFVLRPLAELAPQALHPQLLKTYGSLWAAFDQASQPLERVFLSSGAGS